MSIELKQSVNIVIERDKHIYTFCMPVGAPLGEAYDVAWEVVKAVLGLSKQAVDQAEIKKFEQSNGYNQSGE